MFEICTSLLFNGVRCFFATVNYARFELIHISGLLQELRYLHSDYSVDVVDRIETLILRVRFALNLLESVNLSFREFLRVVLPIGLYKKVVIEFKDNFDG